ncbi:MAG: hypothetical protein RRY26_03335 [Cellulosilyticaceae bacterium]
MVFTLSDATSQQIIVDFTKFKGDDGKTPIFRLIDGNLYYYYKDVPELKLLGRVIGPQGAQGTKGDIGDKGDKGDKGNKGDIGPQHEFKVVFDSHIGMMILCSRIDGSTDPWVSMGPVGGIPGKSPKIIREKGDPNLREDDRIL